MLRLLTVAFGLCVATASWAYEPKLYLSWNRPYGLPGASEALTRSCDDTTRVDTLYLSFDPGEGCPPCTSFVGMTATLRFKATMPGDTLSSWWNPREGNTLPPWARIEWAPDSSSGCPAPWTQHGLGFANFFQAEGMGTLRLIYAVAWDNGVRLKEGQRYGLARILFRSPYRGNLACRQPLTIEWPEATVGYVLREYGVKSDARVSMNAPWTRNPKRAPRLSGGGR